MWVTAERLAGRPKTNVGNVFNGQTSDRCDAKWPRTVNVNNANGKQNVSQQSRNV